MNEKLLYLLSVLGVVWWFWPREPAADEARFYPVGNFFEPDADLVQSLISDIAAPRYHVTAELIGGYNIVNTDLDSVFNKYAAQFGVPAALLKAVAMAESSLNPSALNEEGDGEGGRSSVGLMQILTPNRLNVQGWEGSYPKGGRDRLFDPDFNVYIGAQILRWNLQTYGYPRGIAIYNRWAERNAPVNGPFANQSYVDRVLGYFRQFGGDAAAVSKYGSGSRG